MTEFHLSLDRDKYDGPGYCIYCLQRPPAVVLTDEHIYPFALGGNVQLLQCSCHQCNGITHRLDGYCANRIMFGFRHHYKIQSRTQPRPTSIPIRFKNKGRFEIREVPLEDAPLLLFLPEFEPPGILIEAAPSGVVVPKTMSLIASKDFTERAEKMRRPGDEEWSIEAGGDYSKLCRFIAKVALGGAVAILGYDSALSPLGKIILGQDKNVRYRVGGGHNPGVGPQVRFNDPITKEGFRIGFHKYAREGFPELLGADVTFFYEHGTPTYTAIVGPAPAADLETPDSRPTKTERPQRR